MGRVRYESMVGRVRGTVCVTHPVQGLHERMGASVGDQQASTRIGLSIES